MPASIGVNLRVTGHCSQGGRKYMEDLFSVAYQQTEDERDLEYAFFGIYDGHGGSEAAAFAKEHLMDSIVKQRQFWSDNDEDVLKAIRNGYMLTHLNMWKELEKWPKTVTGLPSTAGTTASVAFIRRGKIYIGHVGDSAIVLGYQKDGSEEWAAKPLTLDHKPESTAEIERIQRCGGKVVSKAGVPRVVWNRPRLGHKGPIKKNTPMDEIPFLAVARSLGDLWSYNPNNDEFIVSPDPDVGVLMIEPAKFRCLIFGTDGLWNMMSPEGAVSLVQATERHNEAALVGGGSNQPRDWLNPSKSLVDHALERWSNTRMRADNTSVVTLMLDPPGPPRATVLRSRTTAQRSQTAAPPAAPTAPAAAPAPLAEPEPRPVPQNGLTIMTRYSDTERSPAPDAPPIPAPPLSLAPAGTGPDDAEDTDACHNYGNPAESYFMARLLNRARVINTLAALPDELADMEPPPPRVPPAPRDSLPATVVPEPAGALEPDGPPSPCEPPSPLAPPSDPEPEPPAPPDDDGGIQINEVSSSSPTEGPPRPRPRRPRGDAAPPHDRVLRSHHDPEPHRPQTRQVATRARPVPVVAPPPEPVLERVVILTRRAPTAPVATTVITARTAPADTRTVPSRKGPGDTPVATDEETKRSSRALRSTATATTPLAQKITRSIGTYARELRGAAVAAAAAATGARAGNSARAPGPARRAPAARRQGAHRSKENLGAARARARARAAPAASPLPHRPTTRRGDSARDADTDPEVHSTTEEPRASCMPPPESARPRALRSRNDAAPTAAPAPTSCKRTRCEESDAVTGSGASKAARLSSGAAERCARVLGKRASGPWAPALALRNRLRRRLGK